ADAEPPWVARRVSRCRPKPPICDPPITDVLEHERLGSAETNRPHDRGAVGLPEHWVRLVLRHLAVVPAPVLVEKVIGDPWRVRLLTPRHHRLAVEVVELRVEDLDDIHGARSVIVCLPRRTSHSLGEVSTCNAIPGSSRLNCSAAARTRRRSVGCTARLERSSNT